MQIAAARTRTLRLLTNFSSCSAVIGAYVAKVGYTASHDHLSVVIRTWDLEAHFAASHLKEGEARLTK